MLLEDNDELRNFLERGLKQGGYVVVSVDNANKAFEMITASKDEFALILSDVVLPDITESQFISNIRDQGTRIRVIFMSGYASDTSLLSDSINAGDAFIQKPFTLKVLLQKVRDVLEGDTS